MDDDEAVRRAFARSLRREHEVVEASSGAGAMLILETRSHEFDAVVTDLAMPNVGGDALVTWLRSRDRSLSERTIVVTGGTSDPEQAAWLAAFDKSRVVGKPFAMDDLVRAITRAIERVPR